MKHLTKYLLLRPSRARFHLDAPRAEAGRSRQPVPVRVGRRGQVQQALAVGGQVRVAGQAHLREVLQVARDLLALEIVVAGRKAEPVRRLQLIVAVLAEQVDAAGAVLRDDALRLGQRIHRDRTPVDGGGASAFGRFRCCRRRRRRRRRHCQLDLSAQEAQIVLQGVRAGLGSSSSSTNGSIWASSASSSLSHSGISMPSWSSGSLTVRLGRLTQPSVSYAASDRQKSLSSTNSARYASGPSRALRQNLCITAHQPSRLRIRFAISVTKVVLKRGRKKKQCHALLVLGEQQHGAQGGHQDAEPDLGAGHVGGARATERLDDVLRGQRAGELQGRIDRVAKHERYLRVEQALEGEVDVLLRLLVGRRLARVEQHAHQHVHDAAGQDRQYGDFDRRVADERREEADQPGVARACQPARQQRLLHDQVGERFGDEQRHVRGKIGQLQTDAAQHGQHRRVAGGAQCLDQLADRGALRVQMGRPELPLLNQPAELGRGERLPAVDGQRQGQQLGQHQQPGQEVVRAGQREPHQLAHHLRPQAAMDVVRVEPFGRRRLRVREQYAHRLALHLARVRSGRGDRGDALHQRVGAEQRLDQRQVAELRVPALDQVGDELAQDVDERAEQLGEQHALLARQAGRVDGRLVEVVRQLVEDGEQQRLPVRRVELEQRVLVLELGVPARLLVVVVRRYAEQPDQPQRGDEIAREGGHVLEAAAHQLHQRPDVDVREQIVQLERLEVDGQLLQGRADARLELLVLLGQGEQGRPVLGQIADGFPVPHGAVHQIDTVADDRRAMLGGGRVRPTDALLRHRALLALEQLQQHRQIVVHREHLHDEAAPGPAGQLVQGVQAVHQPVPLLLQLIVRRGDAAGARIRDRVQMVDRLHLVHQLHAQQLRAGQLRHLHLVAGRCTAAARCRLPAGTGRQPLEQPPQQQVRVRQAVHQVAQLRHALEQAGEQVVDQLAQGRRRAGQIEQQHQRLHQPVDLEELHHRAAHVQRRRDVLVYLELGRHRQEAFRLRERHLVQRDRARQLGQRAAQQLHQLLVGALRAALLRSRRFATLLDRAHVQLLDGRVYQLQIFVQRDLAQQRLQREADARRRVLLQQVEQYLVPVVRRRQEVVDGGARIQTRVDRAYDHQLDRERHVRLGVQAEQPVEQVELVRPGPPQQQRDERFVRPEKLGQPDAALHVAQLERRLRLHHRPLEVQPDADAVHQPVGHARPAGLDPAVQLLLAGVPRVILRQQLPEQVHQLLRVVDEALLPFGRLALERAGRRPPVPLLPEQLLELAEQLLFAGAEQPHRVRSRRHVPLERGPERVELFGRRLVQIFVRGRAGRSAGWGGGSRSAAPTGCALQIVVEVLRMLRRLRLLPAYFAPFDRWKPPSSSISSSRSSSTSSTSSTSSSGSSSSSRDDSLRSGERGRRGDPIGERGRGRRSSFSSRSNDGSRRGRSYEPLRSRRDARCPPDDDDDGVGGGSGGRADLLLLLRRRLDVVRAARPLVALLARRGTGSPAPTDTATPAARHRPVVLAQARRAGGKLFPAAVAPGPGRPLVRVRRPRALAALVRVRGRLALPGQYLARLERLVDRFRRAGCAGRQRVRGRDTGGGGGGRCRRPARVRPRILRGVLAVVLRVLLLHEHRLGGGHQPGQRRLLYPIAARPARRLRYPPAMVQMVMVMVVVVVQQMMVVVRPDQQLLGRLGRRFPRRHDRLGYVRRQDAVHRERHRRVPALQHQPVGRDAAHELLRTRGARAYRSRTAAAAALQMNAIVLVVLQLAQALEDRGARLAEIVHVQLDVEVGRVGGAQPDAAREVGMDASAERDDPHLRDVDRLRELYQIEILLRGLVGF
uniref:Uncharacterized protein n=1 Tax=Anopheles merus TaxID=30066 RepID=A0A182UT52_ANOME